MVVNSFLEVSLRSNENVRLVLRFECKCGACNSCLNYINESENHCLHKCNQSCSHGCNHNCSQSNCGGKHE